MITAREMTASDVVEFVRRANVSESVAIEMVEKWAEMRAHERIAKTLKEIFPSEIKP